MSLNRPDPLPAVRRRPFDELIAELAERTGRPLWKVTRVPPSKPDLVVYRQPTKRRLSDAERLAVVHLQQAVPRLSQRLIAEQFGVSIWTIGNILRQYRKAA
jgi:hypothetical protein